MKSSAVALLKPKEPLVAGELDLPPLDDSEVYVTLEACGLGLIDWNVAMRDTVPRLPLVLGAEAVGRVQAAGRRVKHLNVGSRVGITPLSMACEACDVCQKGQPQYCAVAHLHGFHVDGALCTVGKFAADNLVPAPEDMDAAVLAPLFASGWTAMGALKAAGVKEGTRLLIFGVGGVGHLAVQYALQLGAAVTVVDPDPQRSEFGRELGAATKMDAVAISKSMNATGERFDMAVVCTPSTQAITQACRAVAPAGTVVLVGSAPTTRIDLPLGDIVNRGLQLRGSFLGSRQDLQQVIDLARQGVVVPTVERVALAEAPDRLYRLRDGGFKGRLVFEP